MTVSGNKVTAYSVTDYGPFVYSGPLLGPIPVCGDSFDEVSFQEFTGEFASSTWASGTLNYGFGFLVYSWTATKQ